MKLTLRHLKASRLLPDGEIPCDYAPPNCTRIPCAIVAWEQKYGEVRLRLRRLSDGELNSHPITPTDIEITAELGQRLEEAASRQEFEELFGKPEGEDDDPLPPAKVALSPALHLLPVLTREQHRLCSHARGMARRHGHTLSLFHAVYGAPLIRAECTGCRKKVVIDLEKGEAVGKALEEGCDRQAALAAFKQRVEAAA